MVTPNDSLVERLVQRLMGVHSEDLPENETAYLVTEGEIRLALKAELDALAPQPEKSGCPHSWRPWKREYMCDYCGCRGNITPYPALDKLE